MTALAVDPATHAFGLQDLESQAILTSAALALLLALLCAEMAGWALPSSGGGTTIPGGGAS